MNDNSHLDLFVEIVKLLRRFGPDAFERLASTLESPDLSSTLASVLLKSMKHRKTLEQQAGKRSATDFRSSLGDLEGKDNEKAALLTKLYDALVNKEILLSLRDIKTFASDAGLPVPKADSRSKAIIPLMRSLSDLSVGEIQSRCEIMRYPPSAGDRSLQGWSDIILDRTRRLKDTPPKG